MSLSELEEMLENLEKCSDNEEKPNEPDDITIVTRNWSEPAEKKNEISFRYKFITFMHKVGESMDYNVNFQKFSISFLSQS